MSIDDLLRTGRVPLDAILRSELYSFVQAAFPIVSGGKQLLRNWHIEAMCYMLTRVMRGEIKRLIILVPPRSLKSITASVAFTAFLLGHDPTRRIICVSYAEALARKHAGDTRALMRSPLYRRLFPGTRISPRKDTELEYVEIKIRKQRLIELLHAQSIEPTPQGGKPADESEDVLTLTVKARLQRVGREMRMLFENADDQTTADPGLLRIVARAHDIQERLMQDSDLTVHVIAHQERVSANYVYRLLRLTHVGARHYHGHRQRQEPAATHCKEIDATDTADTGRLG